MFICHMLGNSKDDNDLGMSWTHLLLLVYEEWMFLHENRQNSRFPYQKGKQGPAKYEAL
jgi:hypothetical protein